MNTQTHVLLAVAVVGCMAGVLRARLHGKSDPAREQPLTSFWTTALIVFGALLPDISLFIMFGYAQLTGVPNNVIWSEMYYSPFWQNLGAISNSAPVFLLASLACWLIITRALPSREIGSAQRGGVILSERGRAIAFAVLVFSLASLLHVAADFPLHHDDGHPHFWPFTNWIFASPVSYWDATHYARYWVPIECALGLTLVAYLWKKSTGLGTKGLLLLVGLSYPVFGIFFFS